MLHKIAYRFILENDIDVFNLDFKKLETILKNNNIELLEIEKNKKFIESLGLCIGSEAFNCEIDNKYCIFFKNSLEYRKKIFVIIHEIGHILLNHSGSFSNEQENESNLFACEVLYPSVLINYNKFNSIEKLTAVSLLTPNFSEFYLNNIRVCDMNDELNLAILNKFKNKYPNKKEFKFRKILIFSIIIFLTFSITLSINKGIVLTNMVTAYQDNNTVYITRTGSKYHKENCSHIKNREVIELSLSDKILRNYEPCSVCFG